ncbi:hypothetical protein AVEN_80747-1 [Araneus ventricosus]|uniref:Uncharacterized protein n=1 Tax=Araneus ventricosus TaxID=182803 RepID=A0A4Y2MMG6_ARAVE|nr:hypothetical protein AVEN_80747-1 [Araneus ventricosus]
MATFETHISKTIKAEENKNADLYKERSDCLLSGAQITDYTLTLKVVFYQLTRKAQEPLIMYIKLTILFYDAQISHGSWYHLGHKPNSSNISNGAPKHHRLGILKR